MERIVFSSDDLPDSVGDRGRLEAWRDLLGAAYGPYQEMSGERDRRFTQNMELTRFAGVDVGHLRGTMNRSLSTSRGVSRPSVYFLIRNRFAIAVRQLGREAELHCGTAVLASNTEDCDIRALRNDASFLVIPQARLRQLVVGVEDLVARPVQDSAALRHLWRYFTIVPTPDDADPALPLAVHIGDTLIDLAALALGAEGDAADLARGRGLRMARVQAIIAQIHANFADPAFSPQWLARKLGISARYIQRLLHETGMSFHERVLELRLQRARTMLEDPRHDRLRVGEIAAVCGFNEVPYFNRCFRRRFGETPSQCRGGSIW